MNFNIINLQYMTKRSIIINVGLYQFFASNIFVLFTAVIQLYVKQNVFTLKLYSVLISTFKMFNVMANTVQHYNAI